LVDVRALVTGAIGGSVRVGWFESRFDPCREVRMMLNEIDEEVPEFRWICVCDQFGNRWALANGVRSAAVRQEDGYTMLADPTVIVRTGARRVDDTGFVELDLYLIGLVLTAFDRRSQQVAPTRDLADGAVLVVILASLV
jgi:hypothetical protein